MKNIFFLAAAAVTAMVPLQQASSQSGQAAVQSLTWSPDARGLGLGEGGSVYSEGAVSAYYNPANLITSELISTEFIIRRTSPEVSSDFSYRSVFLSSNYGGWGYYGIGYGSLSRGRPIADNYYAAQSTSRPREFVISLAVATAIDPHISFGAAAKYISSELYSDWIFEKGTTAAIDLGFLLKSYFPQITLHANEQYYPALRKYFRSRDDLGISAGIAITNWGPDISYSNYGEEYPLPTKLRLGVGYQAIDIDDLGLRFTVDAAKSLVGSDGGLKREIDETVWSFGLESAFLYLLHFRLGRQLDNAREQQFWTVGFGIGPEWLRLDYGKILTGREEYNPRAGEYLWSLNCNIDRSIVERF